MSIKTILLAGVMAGALGGVASADPYDQPAPQYQDSYEPAPGTYENGYVWVAASYQWIDGVEVLVPAHWKLAEQPQPTIVERGGWREPFWQRRFERRDRWERRDRDDRRDDRDDRRFDRDHDRDRDDRRDDDGYRTARSYRHGSRY
jgi:hypothetical protein